MPFLSIASLKLIAGATSSIAVIGGGGTVAYIYKDSISDFVTYKLLGQKRKYEYIVATVGKPEGTTTNLYISDLREFACSIRGAEEMIVDADCDIYKLNKSSTDEDTIAFHDISHATKIKKKADLTEGKQIIVKVSALVKAEFPKNNNTFQLVTKTGKKIADLTWRFDLNKNNKNSSKSITSSHLIAIKLTEAASSSQASYLNDYTCEFGDGPHPKGCKVFKATNPTDAYTHETLKTITAVTDASTTIAANSYLFIQLSEGTKSFTDLDDKEIVIKNQGSEFAKGILDNLLIGNLSENGTNSFLYKLSDTESREITRTSANQKYIITRFLNKNATAPATFSKDKVVCRYVEGNLILEDSSCGLYKFWDSTTETHFDLAKLAADGQKIDTDYSDLSDGKYQLVKVSQKIIDKLNRSTARNGILQIMQKDKINKAFNNKFVNLEAQSILTSGTDKAQTYHSNLFIARVQSQMSGSYSVTEPTSDSFMCQVGTTGLNCNVYKLSASHIGNKITSSDITSADQSITPSSDLAVNKYVVIELTNTTKSASELRNQLITLNSHTNEKYAMLDFDQQIFGDMKGATKVGLPLPAKEVSFIVSKETDVSALSEDIQANSRCLLTIGTGSDNFDNSCRLIRITTPTTDKEINTLSELHTLASENHSGSLNLSSTSDNYFKLIVDINKLYNLNLAKFSEQQPSIKLQSADGTKTYGSVKLEQHIIDATTVRGKTDLILGKVKVDAATQNFTSSKCKIGNSKELVDCSLYKNTASDTNKGDENKVAFSGTIQEGNTFVKDDYYAIKLAVPQSVARLKSKTTILYQAPATETETQKEVAFTFEKVMGGDITTPKKLYFLN